MSHRQGFYEKYVKRPQDFICASVALVMLSPVMAATALLVRIHLGSPVIFSQDRPGLDGRVFKLYKFRTMTDEKDEGTFCLMKTGYRRLDKSSVQHLLMNCRN